MVPLWFCIGLFRENIYTFVLYRICIALYVGVFYFVVVLKGPCESPVGSFIVSWPSFFILDQIHRTLKLNTRNILVIGKQLSLMSKEAPLFHNWSTHFIWEK